MNLATAFFYLFAAVTVASAFMVVFARNPVHSVMYLILTFVSSAGLFMLMGAEFLAMILIVVYVGAVAVLFLFVVMMLDVDFAQLREGFLNYLPVGLLVGAVALIELIMAFSFWAVAPEKAAVSAAPVTENAISNTEAIGLVLYTDYLYFFQLAGLVLLVAMIGAIVLTLRHRPYVRRQDISAQVARTKEGGLEIKQVKSGQGL